MAVHIFQTGCRDVGRKGFEYFLDFEEFFPADVSFEGVHCRDFDVEERVERFAECLGRDIEVFDRLDDLYSAAEEVDGTVLIYDAGPPHLHSRNISESLTHGFHHLTEKPPSVTRDEHVSERKLAASSPVSYKVDSLERENPVVMKTRELLEDETVEQVEVFSESSFGVQKVLQPVRFSHVRGGCVLDRLSSCIYVMDFLESEEFSFTEADIEYLVPKNLGGERLLETDGSSSRSVSDCSAVGKCKGVFSSGETCVDMYGSWMGLSERAGLLSSRVNELFGSDLFRAGYRELGGKGFRDVECRFFRIEGSRTLIGDLMNNRLYDMEDREELSTPSLLRGQLYRVLEKSVLEAAGVESREVDAEEVERFMDGLFDIQESGYSGDVFEAVDDASERIRSFVDDKKISDSPDNSGVAR
ncbi:MAG: hypothetical protein ABEJ95_00730 [Candidatus Nanohalobium sp.]